MSRPTTAALVGATGGAGTTRTGVELAATLAREGRTVAVLDAAVATQGLSDYLGGRLDPDLTRVLADDADLEAALVDLDAAVPGRVACCPARAPFERLARAKTPAAARAFEDLIDTAADRFDRVLVDTPPVAANQAVAAVNAADRRALVAPATTRGADAVGRARDRLADLGAEVDAVVSTRGELRAADAAVPEVEPAVADAPTAPRDDGVAAAMATVAGALDWTVDLELDPEGLLGRVRDRIGDARAG